MRFSSLQTYTRFLLKYRFLVTTLLFLLFLFSLSALPKVKFDFSIGPLLSSSRKGIDEIKEFHQKLPLQIVDFVCVLEWPSPVGLNELKIVQNLEKQLILFPQIEKIRSLASIKVVPDYYKFPIPKSFLSLATESSVLEEVQKHPLLQGNLISKEGHSLALLIQMKTRQTSSKILEKLTQQIKKSLPSEIRYRLLGIDLVDQTMIRYMRYDIMQSLVLEFICFCLLLFILFRNLRGVFIPLLVINAAVVFYLGLMVLLNRPISLIGVAIPGLITIIGLCDAVHMMHRFEEEIQEGRNKVRAIVEMMNKVGKACFFTSFTTAIGFISLAIAPHIAVQNFAINATLAVLIAFLNVITLLPLVLSFWPVSLKSLKGGMTPILSISYGKPILTFSLFILIVGLSLAGTTKIDIDSNWFEELPKEEPIIQNLLWFENHFNGILFMEIKIEGSLEKIEAFKALEEFQKTVSLIPEINGVESYTLWIQECLGNRKNISQSQLKQGIQFLKLSGSLFPHHVIASDFNKGRIILRIKNMGTNRFLEVQKQIKKELSQLPKNVKGSISGYASLAHESSRLVVTTMMYSFILSLIAITLLIMILYRSFSLGILSIIPNTLPILVALGINGGLGIDLRIGIVMIYCLGIGLAVDDTIHMLTRFMQESKKTPQKDIREILLVSIRTTGKAMCTTSLVLLLGALCYLPSTFQSMRDVGILLTPIVIVALIADLFLLPLLVEHFYSFKTREQKRIEGTF